jgi:alkylation response protein AidB-like acyl-CoA dehydrogenase
LKWLLEQRTVGKIRELAAHMDKERSFSPEALNIIIEHGWFKLFVPEELGGSLSSLPDALKIFEYASWVDGSFGWLVTIGSGGGYFASYLKPQAAKEIFSPPNAVIAGSGAPNGTAARTNGGYYLNGRWKFCSGSSFATTFTVNCVLEGSDPAQPEIRSFALWPSQVNIIRDWNAFGLKATESHSIEVRNQFVPDERSFSLAERLAFCEAPLFDYPFILFAQTSFAAVSIGICRHLLDEAKTLADRQKNAWNLGKPGRHEFVLNKIMEAEAQMHAAIRQFYQTIDRSWEHHVQRKPFGQEDIKNIGMICQQTAGTALKCGQAIFPYLGINAVFEHEPVNRIWRDLQTVCQHTLLVPFEA